jgi:hypothetical protein
MEAFFRFDVCWVGSQYDRDQIPTHFVDFAVNLDSVFIDSAGFAEIVAVTG